MKRLKAGVIGLGVGERHILSYKTHPAVEMYKACDIDVGKLKSIGCKYANLQLTANPWEVLADPEIDIVSVASYDNFHYQQIIDALSNNKHVYVEKPMCLFASEAKSIRQILSLNKRLKLSSNLTLRTCPRFIRLKDAINSGEIGEVYSIQADYLWGRPDKLSAGWRKDMDFYSIIYGAAVHMVDLVIWLTGMLPAEVCGFGNRIAAKNSGLRYNDFVSVLLRFESGLIVSITAHGGCVHPHFHQIQVFGTKKTFMNNITGGLWVDSNEPCSNLRDAIEEYPGKGERDKVLKSFVDSIFDSTAKPIVTTEDVFNTMSVCFAAQEAVNTGKSIKVEYM